MANKRGRGKDRGRRRKGKGGKRGERKEEALGRGKKETGERG